MQKITLIFLGFFTGALSLYGQRDTLNEMDSLYLNWYNLDPETNEFAGASVDKLYEESLSGNRPKQKIIVAVIDAGVDIEHPDLEGKIWINEDEIPDNGVDDDGNGYVDDVHGWNFIGNSDGENIQYENLELTRIAARRNINVRDYQKAVDEYEELIEKKEKELKSYEDFQRYVEKAKNIVSDNVGKKVNSLEDLNGVTTTGENATKARDMLVALYNTGLTDEVLQAEVDHVKVFVDKYLGLELNAREVVGDDPYDMDDRDYGNNNVTGPAASHGTGVAGLIAAIRGNGIGIDGVASNVEIMSVRVVPDGDERDKDVALGIIYAVDNGAKVINMSFGKGYSPEQEFVDEAIKYAESKNVLLVHAAGNESEDIDVVTFYPEGRYMDGKIPSNFLSVGAIKKEFGKEVVAPFSNYGQNEVDLFAPGVNIVTLDTGGTYNRVNGTSVAAPVVSGVAALILSYYPDIKPPEMIELLKQSTYKMKRPKKVVRPQGKEEKSKKIKFIEMSVSGGILNAYEAFRSAGSNVSN